MSFITLSVLAIAMPVLADTTASDAQNLLVQKYMIWCWVSIIGTLLLARWSLTALRLIRLVVNMGINSHNDGRQRYFSIPNHTWAWIKKQIIHAPLFSKRHNREFKLSSAVNICTLPSRLHFFFLVSYIAANAAFCAITIDWQNKATFYNDAVHRTGIVIVTNMVALFLLAGRNNPLIYLCGISFDTYNLLHRWIGRIVVLESIAHVAFWMASKYTTMSSQAANAMLKKLLATTPLFISGTVGIFALTLLLLHSPGPIRHAFYETFLTVHIILAAVAVGAVWVHLNGIQSQSILLIGVVFWVVERSIRLLTLIRRNFNGSLTKADFEALPGEAVRVSLHIAKPWQFQPGQHVYLYVPSIGLWTSHPFSVVWSEDQDGFSREKRLPTTTSTYDALARKKITMSLIIRRRTGFTNALYRKAEKAPGGKITATAFVEGPYGQQSFRSYGTVMLFAAGVGISHHVPHVRDLVQSYAQGTCATRKVTLVWVIQSPEHLEWIRPWMTQILGMEKRREILKILLFVSRPRSTKEIHSPSSSVQMFPGKPDVASLLEKEQEHQVGAMAVSVCGTGSMADDVRKAVRDRQQKTEMDFFEEAFSW